MAFFETENFAFLATLRRTHVEDVRTFLSNKDSEALEMIAAIRELNRRMDLTESKAA